MPIADSEPLEPLADSESENTASAHGELASKILQLRAKGDAKNNPKKPKTSPATRPTRIAAGGATSGAALDGAATGTSQNAIETLSAADIRVVEAVAAAALIADFEPVSRPRADKKGLGNSEPAPHMSDSSPIRDLPMGDLPLEMLPAETPTGQAPLSGSQSSGNGFSDVKFKSLVASIGNLTELVTSMQEQAEEQNSAHEKAFDQLYEEMSGYKNDFFYERLKPTLRSLLFLLDSIEEFEREVEQYEEEGEVTPTDILKANLAHFRDQLTDTLSMSEMAPIEAPNAMFNAKIQRAVQVVQVESDQHNTVQRQIRGGWTLGGKMLRPADVVVGKSE